MSKMEKMSFREAQLLVLAASKGDWTAVELNNMQVFMIGDMCDVISINLTTPHIVVRIADKCESYCHIDNFSEKVVDECIEILRGVAAELDWNEHKGNLQAIKSNNNPRV